MKTLYLIAFLLFLPFLVDAQCGSVISIGGCGAGFPQSVTLTGSGTWNSSFCGYSTPGNEQVYSFVAPTTGVYSIFVTAAPSYYVDFGWQLGSCASTGWTCFDDINATGQHGSAYWTAGNTYYILLDAEGTGSYSLTFYITCAVAPPANDECVNAIPLTVGATCTYTATTNANATASSGVPAPGCGNYLGGDVWYTVTVPATGHVIIDTQTGTLTDGGMAIYSGGCGSLTLIECDDDDSDNGLMPKIDRSGLTPGSTLYIRFWEYGNNNNGTFSICASDPVTGPCATVTNIASCGTVMTANSGGGTGVWNSGICGTGTPGKELIYTFTPATTGTYFLRVSATGGSNMSYYIQANTCQSGGWSCIARVTGIGSFPINLVGGTTYYILVDDEDASASSHQFYFICPETPGNYLHPTTGLQGTYVGACMVNTCSGVYTDDGGAGVYSPNINGIYRTFCPDAPGKCVRATINNFFVEGGTGCPYELFIIRDGPTQNSPVLWAGCGNWGATVPSQVSTDPSGCLTFQFYSDNAYNYDGWNITLSCDNCSASPTNNDCITATAVCGATNMNSASPGPGVTSTCGGCNLSENYSSWYYFEITNSGRLALDLKPESFFEDYDFALYQASSCAALGNPVRCSYAASPSYCYSFYWWYGCSPARYISNVTFNSINNTTASNSYSDYKSSQQTTVTLSSSYTISITVAGGTQNYIKVWFDWNKNLSFADAGEEYTIASGVAAGTYTVNITIPATARLGQTCFRVINQRSSAPIACPASSCINGEIEDYAIFISDGTHCSNNVRDADEEGVDCGGADCVPCSASYWPTNTGMNSVAADVSEDVTGDSWVNWMAVNAGESYYLMVNNWSPGANGFDLVFNFTDGGAMDCSILPVELLEFNASKQGDGVLVDWTTLSELNCDRFEVLKSYDAGIWKNIGMVKGAGNSSSPIRYNHYDNEPLTQTTYYRLKQVDYDGQLSYSGIVAVSPDGIIPLKDLKASYDHISDQIIVSFVSPPGMDYQLSLSGISGYNALHINGRADFAKTIVTLPASELKNGMYFITLKGIDCNLTAKVIIAR